MEKYESKLRKKDRAVVTWSIITVIIAIICILQTIRLNFAQEEVRLLNGKYVTLEYQIDSLNVVIDCRNKIDTNEASWHRALYERHERDYINSQKIKRLKPNL